jgi:hypothetical protein
MPTVFPILFTALHAALHKGSGALALFPSQTKTFAKVHDTERFTSPTINAPDGLHSDWEFVGPAHTLSPIVAGDMKTASFVQKFR